MINFLGKVNESLFTLNDPDYDALFVPHFFDDIDALFGNQTDLKNRALEICAETDFPCLFDVSLTKDINAAIESKVTVEEFSTEEKTLSK